MLDVENEIIDTQFKIDAYEEGCGELADCYRLDLDRLERINELLKNQFVIGVAIQMGLIDELTNTE